MTSVPFNPDADVYRTHVDELVQWKYGEKFKTGIVRTISDNDSCWADSGLPVSPDGKYFGRLVSIECLDDSCKFCHGTEQPFGHVGEHGQKWWAHYCNECQLSPVSETVTVQGVLF